MEPGVKRVIVEPAVMLPLVGAETSLGNAWVDCVSCYCFFSTPFRSSVVVGVIYLPLLEESGCLMGKTR